MNTINAEVTQFLDKKNYSFRKEIELLRHYILNSNSELSENIKWNAPNYFYNNEDRITMNFRPTKQILLIFHCGAKIKEHPKDKIIADDQNILVWKSNDRAILSFDSIEEIENKSNVLSKIVNDWINATK